jgi:hypothetical protein
LEFDQRKKKTYTKYWNNFSTKPTKLTSASIFLKKLKKYFNQILGFKISLRIKRNNSQKNEAYESYLVEKKLKRYKHNLLIAEINSFLKLSNFKYEKSKIKEYLDEFDSVFLNSPIKEHESGFGYNEGVFFYTLLKIIDPEIVIESGVMKGFTTYLINSATHDNCKIFCYDINFENNMFNSPKATYINTDITNHIPSITNKKTVALWDDHTSQMDRLNFSQKHKIQYNFFDDDLSFLNIHSDGWPPIPTISMLQDIKNKNVNSKTINWISRNRVGKVYLENISNINCIDKVSFHKIFPQLFPITGYKNHSQCSLVINKIS